MAKIDLKLSIPTSLQGITVSQYQKYMKLIEGKEGEEYDEFINIKSLEIFCGLKLKDSYGLPLNQFTFVLEQLAKCFKEETPFIQTFTMTDPKGVEVEFGFIPKLDAMSFGEYVDAEDYISKWDTMHKAMAVLYRPITIGYKGSYLTEDYKSRGEYKSIEEYESANVYSEVMKDAPVNIAIGAMVFFWRLGSKLSRHTMDSLVEEELSPRQKRLLAKGGDGINPSMRSLEGMSESLMKSQLFHYTSALPG